MPTDERDIEQDIAHQRNMLRVLRGRLRQRELQEAQYGLNVPPEVVQEIHELSERIQRHDLELRRLQSEAVVDQRPIPEVEYRALLAQEWDTSRGRPTVAGTTRLELARLQLGIDPQRAQDLEVEIREALAQEQLLNLIQEATLKSIRKLLEHPEDQYIRRKFNNIFTPIMRTLRLHAPLVVPWLLQHLQAEELPNVAVAWQVFRSNPASYSEVDNELMRQFLTDLELEVEERKTNSNTGTN